MKFNRKTVSSLLLALLVLMSGVAAAGTWDAETTTTTTTSDVTGASNSVAWDADNSTQELHLEYNTTASHSYKDLAVVVSHGASDINTSYYNNSSAVNPASDHAAWNIAHSELGAALPSAYNGGTYDIEIINKTDGTVVDTSQITLNKQDTNTTARIWVGANSKDSVTVGDSLTADSLDVETEEASSVLSTLGLDENETTATFEDNVGVDGNNTTQVSFVLRGDTQDAMDAAAESKSSGEWIHGAQLIADSNSQTGKTYLKVYKSSAPDNTTDNYAVYHPSNGTVVMPSNAEFNGASELQVTGVAGDSYSFGTIFSEFSLMDAVSNAV